MNELILDLQAELVEIANIEAESIGWLPLGDRAYLHVGKPDEEDVVITVVGVPDVAMVGMNVVLVGCCWGGDGVLVGCWRWCW